jgi:hypothetical protein
MAPMRRPSTDDAVSQHAIQVDVVLDHVGGDLRQCGLSRVCAARRACGRCGAMDDGYINRGDLRLASGRRE